MKALSCLAESLEFSDPELFLKAHNMNEDTAQSALRLLHYQDVTDQVFPPNYWRAGAHTDFDCLTLLFQRTGDHGLEVFHGRESHTDSAIGDQWTPVEAKIGEIIVNIGDILMSWSDNKFKSNLHRVRIPQIGEDQKERYTVACLNQANTDVVIQGTDQKYPAITGREYITDAMNRNYARLISKLNFA